MRLPVLSLSFIALALPITHSASATVLSDFNSGEIITDFQFEDANGTTIPDASNTGTLGGSFDTDSDTDGVVTNGSGQLDVSPKSNTAFGSHYVDLPEYQAGRLIGLFDVSWVFDEAIFTSQDEEFRLSLMANDPRSTFTTAEIFFNRTSATEVTLYGNGVGDSSLDTPDVILGSSGSLLTMIDLNIGTREFELFYSTDNGASFISAGTGLSGDFDGNTPEFDLRPVRSVRMVLNEDFSDDTLLIERFALSYVVPEPSAFLLCSLGSLLVLARQRSVK